MYQHRHKTHRAGLQGFWYPNFELVESNSGTFDWTVRNSKNGPKALNSGEAPLFLIAIPGFQHICELPDLLTRESVATQLFRLPAASLIKVVSSQYFQYYDDEIKQLQFGIPSQRQTAGLALRTHEDVAYVVDVLRRNGDQDRPKIRELLRDSLFPEASNSRLDRAVNVSLRLWLMINIREQEFKSSSTLQRPCVQWNNESTLDTFLSGLFPKPRWEATPREGKYDPQFTAAFMVNVCGLKLKWTTSLEDHLRLDRKPDSRTLWIFPFKFHLRNLLRSQECLNDNEKIVLPQKLLRETLDSLLLLFPEWNKSTVSLLEREHQDLHHQEPFAAVQPLGIRDFDRWRDRLLELHQDVFLDNATGWRQLFYDRRNPHQWYIFWLALVIAVMTMIATVAGVLSSIFAAIAIWGLKAPVPNCHCSSTV